MKEDNENKKGKGYLSRFLKVVFMTIIPMLVAVISDGLNIGDHLGCHKDENNDSLIASSHGIEDTGDDNNLSNTGVDDNTKSAFDNTNETSTGEMYTSTKVSDIESRSDAGNEEGEFYVSQSETYTYEYDTDSTENSTYEITTSYETADTVEDVIERVIGYTLMILDVDGKALCNTEIKIESPDEYCSYELVTDSEGFAYFDLDYLYQTLGKKDYYVVSKIENIAGSDHCRKIGHLNYYNTDLRFVAAEILAGIQLKQSDGNYACNQEFQIEQGDNYLLSRTNSDGMFYISKLDKGFIANSETSIWIVRYDEYENNYIWSNIGLTYLESMDSDVKYYDYYFD